MSEREKIFGRIREALRAKAHRPTMHGSIPFHDFFETPTSDVREWLPMVGKTFEAQIALFAKNAAELKADFQLLNSVEDARAALVKLRDAEHWKRAACHSGKVTDPVCPALDLPLLRTDRPYDVNALEKCDVGISECEVLVAQTGGIVVTSGRSGGRALSVLPPHHVVLARREQLVPDLPAAFEFLQRKYAPTFPSMISFITGPSRTGDIERILVLGAHGPKKLTILCF